MKQSCGFQANEASDIIDHVLLQNKSSSDTVLRYEMFHFFNTSLEASVLNVTSNKVNKVIDLKNLLESQFL